MYEYVGVAATPDVDGNLYCVIPETELTEGTYWVSVQGNMEFNVAGEWYWSRQTTPLIGSEFFWRCPGDGFANGFTTWTTGSVAYPDGTDYDLSFALYGFLEASKGTITKNTDALLGYNVYLDGVFVEYTTDLYWQYTDLTAGQSYMAGVTSVWDEGESAVVEYEFTVLGETGKIHGFIRDAETNLAIDAAMITAENSDEESYTYETPFGAHYHLMLPEGNYTVTCESDGYETGVLENVEIIAGENINHTFYLEPTKILTGIDEESQLQIMVFPNPASNVINVDGEDMKKIIIMNNQGQVVYQNYTPLISNSISIGDLTSGIYFVQIETSKGLKIEKLVIGN